MGKARAISLKILLHDGTTNGITTIRNDEWTDGEIILADRKNAGIVAGDVQKGGSYILYSQLSCAIFPLEDLVDNIQQHLSQEKWWYKIAIVTTQGKSLSESESYGLTSILKEHSKELGTLLYDDGDVEAGLDTFQKVTIEQFATAAIELLAYCGISLLTNEFLQDAKSQVRVINGKAGTFLEKSRRKEAKDYLIAQGLTIYDCYNYAAMRDANGEYWINANVENITRNWTLIFNDPDHTELIIAEIPAYSLRLGDKNKPGLTLRKDKNCIDIAIDSGSFIDKNSGVDFSPFLTSRVRYAVHE